MVCSFFGYFESEHPILLDQPSTVSLSARSARQNGTVVPDERIITIACLNDLVPKVVVNRIAMSGTILFGFAGVTRRGRLAGRTSGNATGRLEERVTRMLCHDGRCELQAETPRCQSHRQEEHESSHWNTCAQNDDEQSPGIRFDRESRVA